MARIPREEHAKIRERVEIGQQKVAAVAASYDCTPANIYAILAKLRREDTPESKLPDDLPAPAKPTKPLSAPLPAPVAAASPSDPPSDDGLPLFGIPPAPKPLQPEAPPAASVQGVVHLIPTKEVPGEAASPALSDVPPGTSSDELLAPALHPATAARSGLQAPPASPAKPARSPAQPVGRPAVSKPEPAAGSSNSKRAKTGIALLMRTSDGEEAVHPFRSIEELLSAAKPILRTAAKSPEPIWFSIQTVDLDALEDAF
ncbi:hypothetical protein [Muricoccus vinaceus]|uniref:Uncharacterized protein n=1 Tax=Muricoccus vinaceus TaxID=424704 RepID=A0ABV6IW52_9PROT